MSSETDKQPVERLGYTIEEWCAAWSISRPTVYREIRDGNLKTIRIRGRQFIPVSEVRRIFSVEAA